MVIDYTAVNITGITPEESERLKILLTTRVGTVVLDREFGINMDFIDKPYPLSTQLYTIEVIQKIQKYEGENGLKVKTVTFDTDKNDITKLLPLITIEKV